MYQRNILFIVIALALSVHAQTINVRGKVFNASGKPIVNAVVELALQGFKDTTGTDGGFSITKNYVGTLPPIVPHRENMTFKKGVLELSLAEQCPVAVEIFDVKGNLLKKEALQNATAGIYRMDIAEHNRASKLLVIHASIGQRAMTFRYLPLRNRSGVFTVPTGNSAASGGGLAKIRAEADTLKTSAEHYKPGVLPIASYDTVVNITLDTLTDDLVCAGCGKTGHPASGTATMDVEGTTREYMLKLPADYKPGKQYMLIFCPHWLGGTIDDVVGGKACNGPYYGLEKLSEGKAIFIVPQGLKSGQYTGFSNTKGEDITFFRELLAYCNENLCIDQKRVFSTGFSFGGMMSFAVGCAMNDVVRAIAPMSGAFYSGCDSSSQGPIAVWQAHGVSDGMVKLADAQRARDYFLTHNGCNRNKTVPVEPSPCVEYQDCKTGYPYIYCEFDEPGEQHGVRTWAAAAVWKFFSQF